MRLFRLAALGMILLSLGGCQKRSPEPKDAETAPEASYVAPAVRDASRDLAGASITFYGDAVGLAATLDEVTARRFEADTGIKVRVIPRPNSASETYATYQRLFQAKSADADVLTLDVIWPGSMAPHLLDLSDRFRSEAAEHLRAVIANNTIDGRLVAIPWYMDVPVLYYRKDLLARYGFRQPPTTWDELERMAATIQAGERKTSPRFTGFVWQCNTYEGLTCNALEWQVSHGGGTLVDARTRKVQIHNPQAIAAFRRAARWVGGISPRGVTSYQEEDARNIFQGGNAAFMRNWPYAYAAGNTEGSPVRGKFGAVPLPKATHADRQASTLGGWQLGVSAYTRHPEAAAAFVRYLTSPEVEAWRAEVGSYLPTRAALYRDMALLKRQPILQVIAPVLPSAVARPSSVTGEAYNEVSTLYFQAVADVLLGADAEAVTRELQEDVERLLRSEG